MLPAVAMVVAKLTLPHSLPNLLDDYNISIHILIFCGKKKFEGCHICGTQKFGFRIILFEPNLAP